MPFPQGFASASWRRVLAWLPSGVRSARDAPPGPHHTAVFERLDELLPAERGADGTPSATDFLLHDLPAIIDLLAEDFLGRTSPVADDPEIRVLIAAGALVSFVAIYGVLAADNAVDVIYVELGWRPSEDSAPLGVTHVRNRRSPVIGVTWRCWIVGRSSPVSAPCAVLDESPIVRM